MAAFVTVFSVLLLVTHYYVFSHMSGKLGIERDMWLWSAMLVSTFSFFAGMGVLSKINNRTTRALNALIDLWMGVFFILLFELFAYDIIRLTVYKPDYQLAGRVMAVVAICFVGVGAVNALFIRTKQVQIDHKRLKKPVRIAQLSDLHLGSVHGPCYLKKVVAKTNALKPDIVLITGDIADGPFQYSKEWFDPLNDIKAPVYFSPGNHDHYAGLDKVLKILEGTKVRPLVNEKVALGELEIIGVDYSWGGEDLEGKLTSLKPNPDKYTILMAHGPAGFDIAKNHNVDLQLSGHTHGGQFFPFTFFSRIFLKRRLGLYKEKDSTLFITSGTGTWGPPVRVGTNNEIALHVIG